MGSLLLLDDELESDWARVTVRALENATYRVHSEPDGEGFIEAAKRHLPDVVVVDWELRGAGGEHSNGDLGTPDNGVAVASRLVTDYGNVPIVFCTKFKDIRTADRLDPRVVFSVVEKPVSAKAKNIESWVKTDLIPAIEGVRSRSGAGLPNALGIAVPGEASREFFHSLPSEFAKREVDDRRNLRLRVHAELRPYLDGLFSLVPGRWVVIGKSGANLGVVLTADKPDEEPPSLDEIRRLERELGSPVIVVSPPPRVEMVQVASDKDDESSSSWVECNFNGVPGDVFPSVRLERNGRQFDLHFDTGSSHSFLSFTAAKAFGFVNPDYDQHSWTVSDMSARGSSREYEWIDFRAEFDSPSGNDSTPVASVFQVVYDWDNAPISLRCPDGRCPNSVPEGSRTICGRRRLGLLGRDLIRRNRHALIILDAEAMETRIVPRDAIPASPSGAQVLPRAEE